MELGRCRSLHHTETGQREVKPAIAAVWVALTLACTSSRPQANLPEVALPDLSRTEKPVQEQIDASYQALQSKKNDANAYGDLGNLLLAAEYFDAAEPCYLHAQALAGDDPRWPYYLGHVYMARNRPDNAIAAFERALQLRPGDVP